MCNHQLAYQLTREKPRRCALARGRGVPDALDVFVESLLVAGGEECEERVQARNRLLTAEQDHHLEETRTGRAAGQRHANGVDECCRP